MMNAITLAYRFNVLSDSSGLNIAALIDLERKSENMREKIKGDVN